VDGFDSLFNAARDAISALLDDPGYGVAMWAFVGIFVWSGLAKIKAPALAALAMADLGIAQNPRVTLGRLAGLAELTLAALVAFGAVARGQLAVVAIGSAAAVLWAFTVLLARAFASGSRAPCFCFGDSDAPLSRLAVARTFALATAATGLALAPGPQRADATANALILEIVSAFALLSVAALVIQGHKLLRWNRRVLRGG
jgi:hypothetical protein